MPSTVLITGISGFVGPKLAAKLWIKGNTERIIGVTRRRADLRLARNIISEFGLEQEGYRLEYADVTNFASIAKLIQLYQPEWIFHLASQSFVPESIRDPVATFETNCGGTQNVLEAVRLFSPKSRVIFAGSSEEYGLQFKDGDHFKRMKEKYKQIEPIPHGALYEWKEDKKGKRFFEDEPNDMLGSELPINEENPLRPMSPYAVSKIFGDNLCRNYFTTFGIDCVVSRAFNHEGANRGDHFVTSSIVRQLVNYRLGLSSKLVVGDTSVTRDWSHVEDIVDGYILLAEKAEPGSVYVQGSGIETSVSEFISMACDELGMDRTKINWTNDYNLMRPSDVPHLRADPTKIRKLGFKNKYTIKDIIKDQIVYYSDKENRKGIIV